MRNNDPNLPQLRLIAQALGDLRERVVFVGGATAGLLVSDPAAESVRATRDVDAIVEASLGQFHEIEQRIADRGFSHAVDSDVICRWVHRASGVLFDLMPASGGILDFTNRWYADAIRTAARAALGDGLEIRVIAAPAFLATKLEAYAGRGGGDTLASHDIEDILNIVDGRPELADELDRAPRAMRDAVRAGLARLLRHEDFENGLPGMLTDPDRADIVKTRLIGLAA